MLREYENPLKTELLYVSGSSGALTGLAMGYLLSQYFLSSIPIACMLKFNRREIQCHTGRYSMGISGAWWPIRLHQVTREEAVGNDGWTSARRT